MYVHTIDRFITGGSGNLPEGAWVAAAIHPSSEVDACDINGQVIGAGRGIVPVVGGVPVRALRTPFSGSTALSAFTMLQGPADGVTAPGEKLVLLLYEACDDIENPGPRSPVLRQATVKTVPTTQATAQLAFRLPVSGRTLCILSAVATGQDVTVVVTGIRYPILKSGGGAQFVESAGQVASAVTFLATGPSASAQVQAKVIYLTEAFDELAVFVYQAGALAGGGCQLNAELTGERLQ